MGTERQQLRRVTGTEVARTCQTFLTVRADLHQRRLNGARRRFLGDVSSRMIL